MREFHAVMYAHGTHDSREFGITQIQLALQLFPYTGQIHAVPDVIEKRQWLSPRYCQTPPSTTAHATRAAAQRGPPWLLEASRADLANKSRNAMFAELREQYAVLFDTDSGELKSADVDAEHIGLESLRFMAFMLRAFKISF